jgi:site-specific DNA-methyltransferase (adenine-specific)
MTIAGSRVYHGGKVAVHAGDMREVLAGLEADSFDSCVTDPPYGLQFMGREWDKLWRNGTEADRAYVDRTKGELTSRARKLLDYSAMTRGPQMAEFHRQWAEQVYRVLKPGAHMVAFGGDRTYHRLACAIEDAGFEIRHMLLYLYGSGFPKSHDVSKAIDREAGEQRERIRVIRSANKNVYAKDAWTKEFGASRLLDEPITDLAREWEGWGTALKPAVECICLARKPLAPGKTIAGNVMAYGTGGLNIDACRVGEPSDTRRSKGNNPNGSGAFPHSDDAWVPHVEFAGHIGKRWPANVLHDGSPEVVEGFPETTSGERTGPSSAQDGRIFKLHGGACAGDSGSAARFFATFPQEPTPTTKHIYYGKYAKRSEVHRSNFDKGSASRFFYTAKADAADRIGSKHPTVKPLDLIQWLCRLITPPGGTILDPFAGTGTTAEAALREGFRACLIEREPEYLADIDRRMALAFEGGVGRSTAMAKLQPEGEPLPLFADVFVDR